MSLTKVRLFNIFINNLNYEDILYITKEAVDANKKICIGYINPHIVRLLNSDKNFTALINKFDYLRVGGYGIHLASKFLLDNKTMFPLNWNDYGIEYLRYCEKNNLRIFFLGNTNEVLSKCIKKIRDMFPSIKITGYLNGFDQMNENTVDIINHSKSNILWVGLGSPKQEIWLQQNIDRINVNIAQCVGDLYSALVGDRLRGPKILRDNGFEWLFRLLQHPLKFFDRYVIGIPIFFALIIKYKIKSYYE